MENTHPAPADMDKPNEPGADDQVMTDVDELSRQLGEYETRLAEMRELVLRERAELDNQRKRLARDLEYARRFANEKLLADLLPVCDSLERGLQAANADAASLRAGQELTLRELMRVVENNGLKVIDPAGQPFDPELHQAMTMVESPERPSGSVIAVMQKGYVLNGRLLRPALVSVAR
ncbi:MAG TPA: nucleotide exchange factor GrpE [Rhodanobacteraceae bacterium]|nr:nucleotide exchange factor GrpE [Rhodanobacteraceae bacterium]